MDAIPPLADLDPERCYVAWEMMLATAASDGCDPRCVHLCRGQLRTERSSREARCGGGAGSGDRARPSDTARALWQKARSSGGRRNYDKPDNATSLRVPAAKLDQFVDLVGELVTVQARLSEIAARRDDPEVTRGLRGDRAADLGAARELDEHPHDADSRHL